jgi:hypothetical protein
MPQPQEPRPTDMYSILKNVARRATGRPAFVPRPPLVPALEAVYQRLVCRDLARLQLDDVFYPVGSAANYGLFYLILRAVLEFPFARVVELGAGQSTLLLDALARKQLLRAQVSTLEHDEQWATRIAARVAHSVTTVPLRERSDAGISFAGYDLRAVETGPIDFLSIDGPPAATIGTQYSRLGALELARSIDLTRFVIIIDDAERAGERLLADRMVAALQQLGASPAVGHIVANKRQIIIAGGDYVGAAYY